MSAADPGNSSGNPGGNPGENLVLHARDVHFDWSAAPLHWVPGDPVTTHAMNTLHLVLPEGERWFVRVFGQALPHIRDDRLREAVLGFIGQEAVHADAHDGAAAHLAALGVDPARFTAQIEWLFGTLLGDRGGTPARRHQWLLERLAVIAAIEHFTAVLGQWVLDSAALDAAGADPTMLDLLRWHGAEEVEHRSVAHDLYTHLDGGYLRRVRAMAVVAPVLGWMFVRCTRWLMAHDPSRPGKARWRDYLRAARAGRLPGPGLLLPAVWRYLPRGYHPSREGDTARAVAYLAASPAARAAS